MFGLQALKGMMRQNNAKGPDMSNELFYVCFMLFYACSLWWAIWS
jgi:hypothetical protein